MLFEFYLEKNTMSNGQKKEGFSPKEKERNKSHIDRGRGTVVHGI